MQEEIENFSLINLNKDINMCFENKVVFITGANGGLAKSFIEALLKENAKNILYSKRFRKIS